MYIEDWVKNECLKKSFFKNADKPRMQNQSINNIIFSGHSSAFSRGKMFIRGEELIFKTKQKFQNNFRKIRIHVASETHMPIINNYTSKMWNMTHKRVNKSRTKQVQI